MNNINCGVPTIDFPVPGWNQSKKQTYGMKPSKIVVHNTYNSAKAKAEASYMVGNSNWTSFHSVVDETKIVECVPFTRNTWHCGNQYGNMNYIGIEIARSTGNIEDFKKAERNCAKYIAGILKKFGWGIDRVVTHQYCSGKYCPHKTLDMGWSRFLNMVKEEMGNKVSTPAENITKAGYSVKVKVGAGDRLNVRADADVNSKIVSSYRDGSVIYVEHVKRDSYGNAWYKISKTGYVSAKYCVGLTSTPAEPTPAKPVPKTSVVLYKNDGDKNTATLLGELLNLPVYKDDGTKKSDKYDIKYVGGQGKTRKETAKIVFNTYL